MEKIMEKNKESENTRKIKWNDSMEDFVRQIGDKCNNNKKLHIKAAYKNSSWNKLFINLGMFLSPISGTLGGLRAILTNDNTVLPILSLVIGYIGGLVVLAVKTGKYNELAQKHKQASAKYTSLENNIQRQMTLYRKDRIQPNQYLQWLETKFDELEASSPLVPLDIREKYEFNIKLKRRNSSIIINKDYESSPSSEKIILDVKNSNNNSNFSSLDNRSPPFVEAPNQINKNLTLSQKSVSSSPFANEMKQINIINDQIPNHITNDNIDNIDNIDNNDDNLSKIVRKGHLRHTSTLADLNMFSDEMLKYELTRMNND